MEAKPSLPGSGPDRLTLVAFGLFIILGGGASVAIRFTYGELAPFWGATMRFGLAALVFWALAALQKIKIPTGRALTGAVLFGALNIGFPFAFIYFGLVKTPASLYQVTVSIVPILTLFFASVHGLEKIGIRNVLGSMLAVIGIVFAVSSSLTSGVEASAVHIAAIIAGAVCLAEAGVIAKIFPRNHPIATNMIAMTVGTVILFAASVINGETISLPSSTGVWLAFLYLALGASVAAFLMYLFVLNRWTASGTSFSWVLIPIVTTILATTLAGEQIGGAFVIGGLLVMAGVWVGALMPAAKPAGTRLKTVSTPNLGED